MVKAPKMQDITPRWSHTKLPVLNQNVARIAFGCEALGGYNWGNVDIEAIETAIHHVLHQYQDTTTAVLFDTADTYGPHMSEQRLGHALKGRRDRAIVATKFGVRLDDGVAWYDTSPGYADRALDASLDRLQVDYIDLYQLHWPDQSTPLVQSLKALERFRTEGRIRAYGVCNVPPKNILPLIKDFPGLISYSCNYSLIERQFESDIKALIKAGMIFLAYGCLAQGLLSGKYDATTRFGENDRRSNPKYKNFHNELLQKNLAIVKILTHQAQMKKCSPSTLALQFVLANLPGSIPLVGIKSTQQLNQNFAALKQNLDASVLAHLRELI